MQEITDIIKPGALAHFQFYREGNLYYKIDDFIFPVPISDTGCGTFQRWDKGIFFMRWVRIHLEEINKQGQ